jgi:hypothetical protein
MQLRYPILLNTGTSSILFDGDLISKQQSVISAPDLMWMQSSEERINS